MISKAQEKWRPMIRENAEAYKMPWRVVAVQVNLVGGGRVEIWHRHRDGMGRVINFRDEASAQRIADWLNRKDSGNG